MNVEARRSRLGHPHAVLALPPTPWIQRAPNAPYFLTDEGQAWHPIGHNDAVTWPDLAGLFRRRDLPKVEAYLQELASQGVTVLRLMLEYAQRQHRYIENPAGRFVPNMVDLWDTLFLLCQKYGIRILLDAIDTFWTWLKFRHHPYNQAKGGPLKHPSQALTSPEARQAMKNRLSFAIGRWGGSGVSSPGICGTRFIPPTEATAPNPLPNSSRTFLTTSGVKRWPSTDWTHLQTVSHRVRN